MPEPGLPGMAFFPWEMAGIPGYSAPLEFTPI
jgi:hypothetical protein